MEEENYNAMLSTYRKGVDCILNYTTRGNKEVSREIRVDEIVEDGKSKSIFRFRDSENIVDPQQIGGFEKMVISLVD